MSNEGDLYTLQIDLNEDVTIDSCFNGKMGWLKRTMRITFFRTSRLSMKRSKVELATCLRQNSNVKSIKWSYALNEYIPANVLNI